ncbi:hypothetical protein C1645_818952 [Glomus cerebriforme]|uniref:Uncharacterized protein n=1 Tax=Glomus cerebriforme TaxID=658196 RepID=A0A397TA13_9GLOM|nr:hypothetical protein C1645_818952 [Glomus cerebriforme]
MSHDRRGHNDITPQLKHSYATKQILLNYQNQHTKTVISNRRGIAYKCNYQFLNREHPLTTNTHPIPYIYTRYFYNPQIITTGYKTGNIDETTTPTTRNPQSNCEDPSGNTMAPRPTIWKSTRLQSY